MTSGAGKRPVPAGPVHSSARPVGYDDQSTPALALLCPLCILHPVSILAPSCLVFYPQHTHN